MKRIKYISSFAKEMNPKEITAMAGQAARNNSENDITGILMAKGGVFFQIIEGPDDHVDSLYNKILQDPRHKKVITLGVQTGDLKRLFPKWHMKTLNLDTMSSQRLQTMRSIIDAVHKQSEIIDDLTNALSSAAWDELQGM